MMAGDVFCHCTTQETNRVTNPVVNYVTVARKVAQKLRHYCRRQRFHQRVFSVPLKEPGPDLAVSKKAIFGRRVFS